MGSQKKIRRYADVIDVYGINAFELDPVTFKLLYLQIPRTIARRELRARSMEGPADANKVYELVKDATGDEDEADKARTDFMMAELKSGKDVSYNGS